MLTVYGDSISGNCLKVKWMLDALGREYSWFETSVTSGATRTVEFMAKNPAGQVPLVLLEDGRPLAQSNAILLWLAEGTRWIPADAYGRAKMHEWLFWEQYSHEPTIAVARFRRRYLGIPKAELDPALWTSGYAALNRMEQALTDSDWLVPGGPTLADIALVAYTRMAHEGDFDLEPYPAIRAWITRVEAALRIGPYAA